MLIKYDGLDTNWMEICQEKQQYWRARNQFPPMLMRLDSLTVENGHSTNIDEQPYQVPNWKHKL